MIYFNCDYAEGCHPKVLEKLTETNMEQTIGYGMDDHCKHAADLIRKECEAPEAAVHFLVGGTQTNVTVIDAALKPYQGALCAESGHINVHETGALEACGHKCITLPSVDGKITAKQICDYVDDHFRDGGNEHEVQPKMVYISSPTELGTLYKKAELEEIYQACHKRGMYLFLDGARMGYGLMSQENDVTLADIAANTDVFYIGGTKVGALFGEAVVITNDALKEDFRYNIKQHGGMLAKGRLLGVQFEALFEDGLYARISKEAMAEADRIRENLTQLNISFDVESYTNQLFPILPNEAIDKLKGKYVLEYQKPYDANHTVMRICTSWATTEEQVDSLIRDLKEVLA